MERSTVFELKHLTRNEFVTNASSDSDGREASGFISLNCSHLVAVRALLRRNGLPFEDCDQHIDDFIGVTEAKGLIAIGGIEVLGDVALLRSVAVDQSFQGRGLGRAIVDRLHELARSRGLLELYLLTESAEAYFLAYGYENRAREDLPIEVKSTEQFRALCPASAQAMRFAL